MNDIGDIIKLLAKEAIEGDKPVSVVTGEVIDDEEFVVRTEQKLQLSEDFFIITQRFEHQLWKKGDKLLLLRCDGGQKYVILDILPEKEEEE